MRLTYDAAADALAVELDPAARSARTVEVAPDVRLDFDAGGRLITVDILGASTLYARAQLEALGAPPPRWLTLAQAAKESGLTAGTLRVQVHAGRLPARKVGRDWQVSQRDLWNYLESRAPAGRPATRRKGRRRRVRS